MEPSLFSFGQSTKASSPQSRLIARPVPLFYAACLFALGIAAAQALWLQPGMMLVAGSLMAGLCCLAAVRAERIVWLPLAVLWLLLGAWCAEVQPQPAPAPALAALSDNLLRTVEGTVVNAGAVHGEVEQDLDAPTAATENPFPMQLIDLRVASVEVVTDSEDAQEPAPGGVRLTVRWPETRADEAGPQPFACGERVRAVVRLLPPEVYHDPGVWSREDYLLEQGITSSASVRIDRIERIGTVPDHFFACRLASLQHATAARLLALPAAMRGLPALLRLSDDDAIMLAAMATGDRTYLTHNLRVGFERTGSFHMLVVSGLHMAIVAGCIFWVGQKLRLPRVPLTFVTIFGSLGYALFTGFATPVQRSFFMIALYLLGRLLYRERSPLNTIGFAALCLLAWTPNSLFDASFQMTLLAVVSIAGVAAPLLQGTVHPYVQATRNLRQIAEDAKLPPRLAQFRVLLRMFAAAIQAAARGRFAGRVGWHVFPWTVRLFLRAVELLAVSCVVEMTMTLPMALYFHRITVFALPVNVFILPLLLILMPAALLTLLALAIWPPLALVPAMVVAVFLHVGIWLVLLFGSLRWGDLRVPAPLLWQSITFCALLAVAMMLARLALRIPARWPRRMVWVALILAAIVAVVPRPVDHPHDALLMEAIDVGQGDSLLLITPGGKTMLVDGGGFGGGPRQAPQNYDIGEEVVSEVLWARGIRHLDVVALTHGHSDHMGGLPAVFRNFHPDEFWIGNNPHFPAYDALLAEAAGLHIRIRSLRAGDAFPFGATQVTVLAPMPGYQPGPEPTNNDSLVMRVAYGATSVMLEGDAEAPIEQEMLSEKGLASTLLKVGHHGSITSTRPAFLARVAPQWAVISCGLHNRYGHPRIEVLRALEDAGVHTFSTDINGATCFRLNGKTTVPDLGCGWRPRY